MNLKLTCVNIRTFYSVQLGWWKNPRFLHCSICRSRVVCFSLRPTYNSMCNSINNKSINLIHRKWAEFTGPMAKCKTVQVFWVNVPPIWVITRVSEGYSPSVFQYQWGRRPCFFPKCLCQPNRLHDLLTKLSRAWLFKHLRSSRYETCFLRIFFIRKDNP